MKKKNYQHLQWNHSLKQQQQQRSENGKCFDVYTINVPTGKQWKIDSQEKLHQSKKCRKKLVSLHVKSKCSHSLLKYYIHKVSACY